MRFLTLLVGMARVNTRDGSMCFGGSKSAIPPVVPMTELKSKGSVVERGVLPGVGAGVGDNVGLGVVTAVGGGVGSGVRLFVGKGVGPGVGFGVGAGVVRGTAAFVGGDVETGVLPSQAHAPQTSGNSFTPTFRQASSSVNLASKRLLVCSQVILAPQE